MMNLKEIVKRYDSFAWLPTIRGALSLDLIENSRNVLGDVDKYVAKFKRHNGVHSEHYIAATSLLTVNDSKFGSDYARTFRFVFVASINNSSKNDEFIQSNGINNPETQRYFSNEGVLLGRLTIITELTNIFSNLEVRLLKSMKSLVSQRENFNRAFYIEASAMEVLEAKRNLMLQTWQEIESLVTDIENADDNRPVYCFDVFLTRDGILLMRDRTKPQYRDSYASSNTCNDYTNNIPLHRLFKVAMNYVKFLFHSNYHHNEDHDTYLPASNIHPYIIQQDNDLRRIFRHQLNAFLTPIMKLKRCDFKDYPIDANGIIIYAKSFVNVFKYNSLVDLDCVNKAEDFISIQESEINHLLGPRKNILNTFLTQNNIIFIFTGILAFVVAILSIITTFTDFKKIDLSIEPLIIDHSLIGQYVAFVLLLIFIGFLLYIVPHTIVLKNQFKRNKSHRNILFVDSNLNDSRISYPYRFYVFMRGVIFISNKTVRNAIIIVLMLLMLFSALLGGYFILK